MKTKKRKIVLFDIDGTLLLTGGAGIGAFNRAFKEMYDTDDVWNNYDPHGKTDQAIIDDLSKAALGYELSRLEKIELGRRYVRYFKELIDHAPFFRLLTGAVDLLKALAGKKYMLGIATGNFKQTARYKLKRGKIDKFFSFGGYGSDAYDRLTLTKFAVLRGLEKTRGQVKQGEVVLIGDARQDIECGKALGLRIISVATGTVSKQELAKLKPDLLLKDLTDLKSILSFIE